MVFTIFITSFLCFLCFVVASENDNDNNNDNNNGNDNGNNDENNDDNILIKGHLDAIDAAFNNSETDTWEGLLLVKKGAPSAQPFYSWCKCGAKFKIRAPAKCRPKHVPYPAVLGHIMLDGIDNPTSKVIAKAYNKFLEKPFDYLANGFLLWANKKKEKIYARHTRDVIGESQAQCIARAIEYKQKASDGTPFVLEDLVPLGQMKVVNVSPQKAIEYKKDENDKIGSKKKRGKRRGRRRSSTVELDSSKTENKHGSSRSRRNSKTKKPKVLSERDQNKEKSVSHDSKDKSSESIHRGDHSHGRESSRRRHSRRSSRRRSSRHRSRGSMDINVRTSTPEKSSSHRASGDRYSPSAFSLAQSEEEEYDNGENDSNMVIPLSQAQRAMKLSRRLVFLSIFCVLCIGVFCHCFYVFGVMFLVFCFFGKSRNG